MAPLRVSVGISICLSLFSVLGHVVIYFYTLYLRVCFFFIHFCTLCLCVCFFLFGHLRNTEIGRASCFSSAVT